MENHMNNVNPLLGRIKIPGETFRLPSRGKYYTNGELSEDVVDGEVQVTPITTIDELVMKSPDKLYTGKAVEEVFRRRIPQIEKPMDLLSKDVDYLLMCLRLVSYGENMELTITHDCENAEPHKYLIHPREILRATKEMDPTKKFIVNLPNEQVVEMRPPKYRDVVAMFQARDDFSEMTNEEAATIVIRNVASMILKVDDVDDREMIEEWVSEIPAGWITLLADQMIDLSDWGMMPKKAVECPDCGTEWQIDVPTNPITFFT
jgi:hypothetical protein